MIDLICTRTCGTCRKTVALLDEHGVRYRYREYREDPLSEEEIREVLDKLGARASELLRRRDKVFKELGLSGEESDDELVSLMSEHPTLLQRPIAVKAKKAAVGRPPEAILEMLGIG